MSSSDSGRNDPTTVRTDVAAPIAEALNGCSAEGL